ncbi:related to Pab1 dependent poly(A)-specific ribonuclease PAN3 [Serendipita indica DSM 11827]|uniref:PAN2-PAN3 deadenylation complex subunit PAN3 n=1 Tax=Serendipita indica (strain DSM 11827) TaxID=1109443 RepID=G4T570_SERID|nr:related to Pab1 dependent poly(A)-specific ribonuclease PAN3 [Serendipita indica DSM 11827]
MPPQPASSAIQIVNPGSSTASASTTVRKPSEPSQQRQCRNVLIYGNCKYEGKGCAFYHPPKSPQAESLPDPNNLARIASPVLAQHVNAPEFVPGALTHGPTVSFPEPVSQGPASRAELQDSSAEEFYAKPSGGALYPLDYHLYTKSAVPVPDQSASKGGFFVAEDIRLELQRRMDDIWAPPVSTVALPEVHHYHSLSPLEPVAGDRRKYFGHWNSICYRAISTSNGSVYALRRLENFHLAHESILANAELWKRIIHPNIASFREAFTTRAFNDSSLVLVYDYYPLATTLFDTFLKPRTSAFTNRQLRTDQLDPIPETTLWSFLIQIANAMKAIHDRALAFRVLDATKILLTGKSRLHINCCGLADLVGLDTQDRATQQQEDMIAFGRLMLALCCRNANIGINYAKTLEFISRVYSQELKNAIHFLLQPPPLATHGTPKIIGQVFDFIGGRLLQEMDAMQLRSDSLEAQLACELENGRLVRLLSKFGFINERPEFARDFRWSETGDKYIVKLFRDLVFHAVDEHGRPVVSLSHVLMHLNKLDCGSEEKLMLVSRDEQSCLVVSYKEIKRCVESAFRELVSGVY